PTGRVAVSCKLLGQPGQRVVVDPHATRVDGKDVPHIPVISGTLAIKAHRTDHVTLARGDVVKEWIATPVANPDHAIPIPGDRSQIPETFAGGEQAAGSLPLLQVTVVEEVIRESARLIDRCIRTFVAAGQKGEHDCQEADGANNSCQLHVPALEEMEPVT